LDEYTVGGIKTTLPFFREVVRDAEFIEGRLDTGFIERFFARREKLRANAPAEEAGEADIERRDMAIIAAALDYAERHKNAASNQQPREQESSQWKLAGRAALLRSRDV
jgi:acetyl-CoA carboxylase biotin carboxylase subunit